MAILVDINFMIFTVDSDLHHLRQSLEAVNPALSSGVHTVGPVQAQGKYRCILESFFFVYNISCLHEQKDTQ